MPKLNETPDQKVNRLSRRFGQNVCTVCGAKFLRRKLLPDGKVVTIKKSENLISKFTVSVHRHRFVRADVCYRCVKEIEEEINMLLMNRYAKTL